MTDRDIPEAWPALLSREQLRAYLGGIGDATVRKVCPVRAVELGANILRYRRADIDGWLTRLAARGLKPVAANDQHHTSALEVTGQAMAALERVRARNLRK